MGKKSTKETIDKKRLGDIFTYKRKHFIRVGLPSVFIQLEHDDVDYGIYSNIQFDIDEKKASKFHIFWKWSIQDAFIEYNKKKVVNKYFGDHKKDENESDPF